LRRDGNHCRLLVYYAAARAATEVFSGVAPRESTPTIRTHLCAQFFNASAVAQSCASTWDLTRAGGQNPRQNRAAVSWFCSELLRVIAKPTAAKLADRILEIRVYAADSAGKMNCALATVAASCSWCRQFTLLAGHRLRPSPVVHPRRRPRRRAPPLRELSLASPQHEIKIVDRRVRRHHGSRTGKRRPVHDSSWIAARRDKLKLQCHARVSILSNREKFRFAATVTGTATTSASTYPRIALLFSQSIKRNPDGSYYLQVARGARVDHRRGHTLPSVKSLEDDQLGGFMIVLNDDTREPLDPANLEIRRRQRALRARQGRRSARAFFSARPITI